MVEGLWPGTPPIFVRNTGPLNDVTLPKLDEPADEFSTGSDDSTAIVSDALQPGPVAWGVVARGGAVA